MDDSDLTRRELLKATAAASGALLGGPLNPLGVKGSASSKA